MSRRKLRPHETARRDQAMAYARDRAAEPGTFVAITEDAEPGIRCGWCDCPLVPPSRGHDPDCVGCSLEARYAVYCAMRYGRSSPIAVCEEHYPDVPRFLAELLGDRVAVEFAPTWQDES